MRPLYHIIPLVASLIGITLTTTNHAGILIGAPSVFLYTILLTSALSQRIYPHESNLNRKTTAVIFLFAWLITSNTIIYYLYKITPTAILLTTLAPTLIFLFKKTTEEKISPLFSYKKIWQKIITEVHWSIFIPIIGDLVLLIILWYRRTADILPSPWQLVGPKFFLLFTVTTLALWYAIAKTKHHGLRAFATGLHLFLLYGVAIIVYKLGYGYDGFIHRATELWIYQHGFIAPKTPFYIGQYTLVNWLTHTTRLGLFFIDSYLVPVLAATLIPLTTKIITQKFPDEKQILTWRALWIIALLFIITINLTTPHNLVLLIMLITIPLLYAYTKKIFPLLPVIALTIIAALVHPLLGAPLALIVLMVIAQTQFTKYKKTFISLCLLGITFLAPLLFATLLWQRTGQFPTLTNPFSKLNFFFDLFRTPYWYKPNATLHFEVLYTFEWLAAPLVALCGLIHWWKHKKTEPIWNIFLLAGIALIISGWLLRSWIVFPDVGSMEQGDYPLRLIKASVLLFVPGAIATFIYFQKKLKNNPAALIMFAVISAGLITASFYLTYPQRNQKVQFPGYNVTQADMDAVHFIHNDNKDYEYIVLANPLVGAAALTEYSFVKYFPTEQGEVSYYSIPSGSNLFRLYTALWSSGGDRRFANEAMDFVGVRKAYFVLPSFWTHFKEIVAASKKNADSWKEFDEGKIVVFTYIR